MSFQVLTCVEKLIWGLTYPYHHRDDAIETRDSIEHVAHDHKTKCRVRIFDYKKHIIQNLSDDEYMFRLDEYNSFNIVDVLIIIFI